MPISIGPKIRVAQDESVSLPKKRDICKGMNSLTLSFFKGIGTLLYYPIKKILGRKDVKPAADQPFNVRIDNVGTQVLLPEPKLVFLEPKVDFTEAGARSANANSGRVSGLGPEPSVDSKSDAPVRASLPRGVINVPDKGNCLFCAVAVALKIHHPKNISNWHVDPSDLVGDLGQRDDLFAVPEASLREAAGRWLLDNYERGEVQAFVLDSLENEIHAVRTKVNDSESIISVLQNDIEVLEGRRTRLGTLPQKRAQLGELLKSRVITKEEYDQRIENFRKNVEDLKVQLDQKEDQLLSYHDEVKKLNETVHLMETDHRAYIQKALEKGIYAGTAQIVALSAIFDVPVTVHYGFNRRYEEARTFNLNNSVKAPIHIAHVNGNHFQYYPGIG